MRRDTQEELQRLNQELLEQNEITEPEEYCESRNVDHCRVYNTDRQDVDLEDFGQQVEQEPKESISGLLTLAFVLLTGIFCTLIYIVLYSGGWLG